MQCAFCYAAQVVLIALMLAFSVWAFDAGHETTGGWAAAMAMIIAVGWSCKYTMGAKDDADTPAA